MEILFVKEDALQKRFEERFAEGRLVKENGKDISCYEKTKRNFKLYSCILPQKMAAVPDRKGKNAGAPHWMRKHRKQFGR